MSKKKIFRFPRMEGITPKVVLAERILHHTYNKLASDRSVEKRMWRKFDIYKAKRGARAPFMFMLLARILVHRKIDPSVYLKVMSQYGKFSRSKFLPPPEWLASKTALEIFAWKNKSERAKWDRHTDWKKALEGHNEKDIFRAIQSSAEMVQQAEETFHMGELEVVLMLKDELNPWFLATYLPCTTEKFAITLMGVLRAQKDLHRRVVLCLRYFKGRIPAWRRARKVFRRMMVS